MARYTLVYGVRLIPEGTLKGVDDATLHLADGSTGGLTLHTFDGTIPQLRDGAVEGVQREASGGSVGEMQRCVINALECAFGNQPDAVDQCVASHPAILQ